MTGFADLFFDFWSTAMNMNFAAPTTRTEAPPAAPPARARAVAPSLRDALRERPGATTALPVVSGVPTRKYDGNGRRTYTVRDIVKPANPPDRVTCEPMWTPAEFRTFDRLSAMSCSADRHDRERGKIWLARFEEKHGKDMCQMMLAEIRRRAELAWLRSNEGKRK